MKYGKIILSVLIMSLFAFAVNAAPGCTGSIMTTDSLGETVNKNHYAQGDSVYINGDNFDTGAQCTYTVEKVNNPNKGEVANGNVNFDSLGAVEAYFVFDTTNAEAGEYKVEVTCGECKKSDNFQVDQKTDVPEFSVLAASVALFGASAGYLYLRRKQ